jgi:pimeloyl-ACP methyl ester carboxylesterase
MTDTHAETETARRLEVPGATLHYEVTGTGPVLAVVGLPMTGNWFAPLVEQLREDFTVVTYDPRGFGRSTIDDPEQDSTPEITADDVSRVLDVVTDEPAYVFGSSGGAVTGLALVAAHPLQVRTLVAHEPPLVELLDDADDQRRKTREVYDTFLAQGAGPAFGKFMLLVDPDAAPPAGAPEQAPTGPPEPPSEQDQADGARMLAHSLLPTTSHRPDVSALRAAQTRVLLGGGAASGPRALARRAADALAAHLGREVVEFPGGHGGFLPPEMGGDPAGFAAVLRRVLID